MAIQKTDWGQIQWQEKEDGVFSMHGLQVGIVSLFSGAHQPKHVHYEEQVIYVIQGQAISYVDGVESHIGPGDFFHWKAGITHEVYSIGNVPFQHLLISNPNPEDLDYEEHGRQDESDQKNEAISADILYIAAEAVRTQFLETLHYAYAIFDSVGNPVLQSQYFPEYCMACCQPIKNIGCCSCMHQLTTEAWKRENSYICKYGMQIFHYPIYFKGVFLGYILGGYVRHSNEAEGKLKDVYDVPKSVIAGIHALMKRIVKAIRNYCEFEQFRRQLMEKELRIASHEETQRILMKNLRDTENTITDLKINNHFLFNTLNSMAGMALEGGLMPLYQSIVDLSKMFHYTLRTQSSVVTLDKELEYVKAYLQLQKLRYEEDLVVNYKIAPGALMTQVPFNFLQPVVENAFIHGFSEAEQKRIGIMISMKKETVQIKVINSGLPLTKQKCNAINQGIRSNTSHGLSMIDRKLRATYGDNCDISIGTEKNGDTCVKIEIPYRETERRLP